MMDDEGDDSEDDFGLEEEGEDDFRERTAWQSKHDAKMCFGCGKAFSLVSNRHHHCRQCGRVVCGDCSPWKDRVKGYRKPQRTCHGCHEDLVASQGFKKVGLGLLRACPCFRWCRREVLRTQHRALLSEGAVFVRRRQAADAVRAAGRLAGSFAKSLFGSGSGEANGDDESLATSRCRVALNPGGTGLEIKPVNEGCGDDEDVALHDVAKVAPRGDARGRDQTARWFQDAVSFACRVWGGRVPERAVDALAKFGAIPTRAVGSRAGDTGLALLGANDAVLFEGQLVERRTRDAWVKALTDVCKDARSKPPPPRAGQKPKTRVELAARRAQREVELATRKRDAEKLKAKYAVGGMKYTALAMANRPDRGGVV